MTRTAFCTLALSLFLLTHAQPGEARRAARSPRVALLPLSASGPAADQAAASAQRAIVRGLRAGRRTEVLVLQSSRAAKLRLCVQQPSCVRAVAARFRAGLLLTGHVEQQGKNFHLDLRVISGRTGEVVANETYEVRSPREPGPALRVAQRLLAQGRAGKGSEPPPETSFSQSDAEAAAAILEQRDTEDPLEPGQASASAPADRGALAVAAEEEPPPVKRSFGARFWPVLTLGAVGVGALGTGMIFGLVSRGAESDGRETPSQIEALQLRDKAQQNALVANILFGVGGGLLLTSGALLVVELVRGRPRERKPSRVPQLGMWGDRDGALITAAGVF